MTFWKGVFTLFSLSLVHAWDTHDLFLNNNDSIFAVGDFNGDKHNDIVSLSIINQKWVANFHIWDPAEKIKKFQRSLQFELPINYKTQVLSIVPIDWNLDGRLDILITTMEKGKDKEHFYGAYVYAQAPNTLFFPLWSTSLSSIVNLAIMDINFDGYPDIIGQGFLTAERKGDPQLLLWLNPYANTAENANPQSLVYPSPLSTHLNYLQDLPVLSQEHSSALVDMTGDCWPDLVLDGKDAQGTRKLFIYPRVMDRYSTGIAVTLPSDLISQVEYIDMNGDGTIDIVLPTCTIQNSKCTQSMFQIWLNRQPPLCSSSLDDGGDGRCRSQMEICKPMDFSISSQPINLPLKDINKSISTHAHKNEIPAVYHLNEGVTEEFALDNRGYIVVHMGDVNSDSYPDFVTLIKREQGSTEKLLARAYITSLSDESGNTSPDGSNIHLRVASDIEKEVDFVDKVSSKDSSVMFYDAFDDGSMDILISACSSDGDQPKCTHQFLSHDLVDDFYFFKSTILAPLCMGPSCTQPQFDEKSRLQNDAVSFYDTTDVVRELLLSDTKSISKNFRPYGSILNGAMVRLIVTDISGNKSLRSLHQLPGSYKKRLPYAHIGLGRTNNYIERVSVGATSNGKSHQADFISLIPNAEVFFTTFPYDNTDAWKIELRVSPKKYLRNVVIGTVVSIMMVAIAMIIIDRRDKMNEVREQHSRFRIHFISA